MIHRITKKHHRPIGFLLIFVGLLVAILSVLGAVSTNASSGDNVYGAAWSSTVGWIAFNNCDYDPAAPNHSNCSTGSTNFGVKVDATSGNITGAAWSSNIGWVSFNPSDTSQCGTSAKVSNIQDAIANGSSPLVGWARALNPGGGQNGDGFWNGCLSLNNSNHGWSAPYRVTLNYSPTGLSTLTGEAWGDEVLGWVSFSGPSHSVGVDLASPDIQDDVTFVANPSAIIQGQSSMLEWTTSNVTGCTIEGALPVDSSWPANTVLLPFPNGNRSVSPSVTTTYEIECMPTDINDPIINKFATVTVTPPTTAVMIDAQPVNVSYNPAPPNYATDITYWTTTPGLSLNSCTLKRRNDSGSSWMTMTTGISPIPTQIVFSDRPVYDPPSPSTSFQLVGCKDAQGNLVDQNGDPYDSNIVTVYPVAPNPSIDVFSGPSCILPGDAATLQWQTSDMSSCTLSNGVNPPHLLDSPDDSGTDSPSINTTYTLSCTGIDGTTHSESITVQVTPTCVSFCVANPTDPSCINPNPDPRPIFEEF